MKITHTSAERLILEERYRSTSVLLWIFTLGAAATGVVSAAQGHYIVAALCGAGVVLGLLLTFLFVRRVRVIFDKPGNSVEIRCRSLRDLTRTTTPLTQVEKAVLQIEDGDEGAMYRIALDLSAAPEGSASQLPLSCYFSSGLRDKEEAIAAISRLIGTPDPAT